MTNKILTTRYPWDVWLKPRSRPKKLVRGTHYYCMTHSMVAQIRNAACTRGLRVSVKQQPDSVMFSIVE